MAGCGGSCGSGSCGGGAGHHSVGTGTKDPKIGEELPTLPYETIYVRCQCGAVGFTPETWKEIGPSVITSGGKHYPTGTKSEWRCEPYTTLVGDDRQKSDTLWNLEKKP